MIATSVHMFLCVCVYSGVLFSSQLKFKILLLHYSKPLLYYCEVACIHHPHKHQTSSSNIINKHTRIVSLPPGTPTSCCRWSLHHHLGPLIPHHPHKKAFQPSKNSHHTHISPCCWPKIKPRASARIRLARRPRQNIRA